MSKKQSRQNRGARTGGHERSATEEIRAHKPTQARTSSDPARAIGESTSHKKERKFGHN